VVLTPLRSIYVSATGATKVSNLSYANRLGLWQTGDFPFTKREDFLESIEIGGIAAMEVVARDLKALGLYLARSLILRVEVELKA
jgi:P-loop containing NTP hydrolase pore-1